MHCFCFLVKKQNHARGLRRRIVAGTEKWRNCAHGGE